MKNRPVLRVLITMLVISIILIIVAVVFSRLNDLDRVAKWQSFLSQVPTNTGVILARDQTLYELGDRYHLPVALQTNIFVDRVNGQLHSFSKFAIERYSNSNAGWDTLNFPTKLWYADINGKILGSYEAGLPDGPNRLYDYKAPDRVPVCQYSPGARVETKTLSSGLTFVQIWGDGSQIGCNTLK